MDNKDPDTPIKKVGKINEKKHLRIRLEILSQMPERGNVLKRIGYMYEVHFRAVGPRSS